MNNFRELKICVVIPTYNNEKTLEAVVNDALRFAPAVMVVNDGSTDFTPKLLNQLDNRVIRLSYDKNQGKGHALQLAFREALSFGYDYVISMDADGQHKADDLQKFAKILSQNPDSLIVGSRSLTAPNMPKQNTFANRFSNFWFAVQTLHRLPDTQSGFRAYPLRKMGKMRLLTSRYEAELELLVRCAWRGIALLPLEVDVYYPPQNERVSHFRPRVDFLRISVLNTILCLVALVYGYPSMLFHKIFKK